LATVPLIDSSMFASDGIGFNNFDDQEPFFNSKLALECGEYLPSSP
jgi:hypothetical protein